LLKPYYRWKNGKSFWTFWTKITKFSANYRSRARRLFAADLNEIWRNSPTRVEGYRGTNSSWTLCNAVRRAVGCKRTMAER